MDYKTKTLAALVLACAVQCGAACFAAPSKTPAKKSAGSHSRPAAAHSTPAAGANAGASANAKAPAGALNSAYTAYINRLRGKLDNNWYLADGKNTVTISADVAADGSVTNLNVTSSPSNTLAEQAASDAFNHSQPLEALPATSGPIKLTLVFQSTADPHGDNNRNIRGTIEAQAAQASGGGSNSNGSSGEDH